MLLLPGCLILCHLIQGSPLPPLHMPIGTAREQASSPVSIPAADLLPPLSIGTARAQASSPVCIPAAAAGGSGAGGGSSLGGGRPASSVGGSGAGSQSQSPAMGSTPPIQRYAGKLVFGGPAAPPPPAVAGAAGSAAGGSAGGAAASKEEAKPEAPKFVPFTGQPNRLK